MAASESNVNVIAIVTPPPCLTIPLNSTNWELNSTNCDEGDDLLKIKLDEQLKEIRKCHHQKYLTKPIINNINENQRNVYDSENDNSQENQ